MRKNTGQSGTAHDDEGPPRRFTAFASAFPQRQDATRLWPGSSATYPSNSWISSIRCSDALTVTSVDEDLTMPVRSKTDVAARMRTALIRSEPDHLTTPIELVRVGIQGFSEGINCGGLEREQPLVSASHDLRRAATVGPTYESPKYRSLLAPVASA